jgi:hypothetical protein
LVNLPDLPEPDSFSLKEIAKRWNCDLQKIVDYCTHHMLNIGQWMYVSLEVRERIMDSSESFESYAGFTTRYETLNGFYYLPPEIVRQLVQGSTLGDGLVAPTIWLYPESGMPGIELHENIEFERDELRISKFERDRFEHNHGIEIDAQDSSEKNYIRAEVSAQSRATYLRIIAALVELKYTNEEIKNSHYTLAGKILSDLDGKGLSIDLKKDGLAKNLKDILDYRPTPL